MLTLVQRPVVRLIMIGLILLSIQTTFLADVKVFGYSGDIMLGASLVAGLVGGPERGALAGFVFGLMYDLLLITPLGLSPLSYGLIAFAVGAIKALITVGTRWWLTLVLVVAGSVAGIVTYAVVGSIIGQVGWVSWSLLPHSLVVGGINGLIAVPFSWAMKWALRVERVL